MNEQYNDFLKQETQDEFATEKINVISNCLLGNYDQEGDYVIPQSIVSELVKVKKVKKSVFKNSVFCSAFVPGYGEVVFEVTFQKNTVKDLAMSELYVLENEYKVNGYIQNTIRTKISAFTDKLEGFIENSYQNFNIRLKNDDESGVKEFKITDEIYTLDYISAKRNFNLNMAKLTKKEYNKLYKEYVTARLELLKGLKTPFSQTILERFNQEYSKIEKFFLQTENYKAVSELLDKCIEDVQSTNPLFAKQEQEFAEKSKPIIEEFSKRANEIAVKAHPKAVGDLSKADRLKNEELEQEMLEHKTSAKPVKEPAKTPEKASTPASGNSSGSSKSNLDKLKTLTSKVGAKSDSAPLATSGASKPTAEKTNPDLITENKQSTPSSLENVLDKIEKKVDEKDNSNSRTIGDGRSF